jgi:hypothetical protein
VQPWDIPDPAGRPIDEVRDIRDTVEAHVRELIDDQLDAIAPTAPRTSSVSDKLLPELAAELASSAPVLRTICAHLSRDSGLSMVSIAKR